MMTKEEYKKEIVRMWDSIRDDEYKGTETCAGVPYCDVCPCDVCPLYKIGCGESSNAFEMIEAVEKWSKEHPEPKYKVSKMEYDFLEPYLKYNLKFYQSKELYALLNKGYFAGATSETNIRDYFNNCEVKEDV